MCLAGRFRRAALQARCVLLRRESERRPEQQATLLISNLPAIETSIAAQSR